MMTTRFYIQGTPSPFQWCPAPEPFEPAPAPLEPERLDVSNKTLDEIRELVAADKTAAKFEGEVSIEWGPVCARLLELLDAERGSVQHAFVSRQADRIKELLTELEKTRGWLADVRDKLECANQLCAIRKSAIEELAAQRDKLKQRLDNGEPWPFNAMARQFGPELEKTKAELEKTKAELAAANKGMRRLKRELGDAQGGHKPLAMPEGGASVRGVHECARLTVGSLTPDGTKFVKLSIPGGWGVVNWVARGDDARKLGRLLLGAADSAEGI